MRVHLLSQPFFVSQENNTRVSWDLACCGERERLKVELAGGEEVWGESPWMRGAQWKRGHGVGVGMWGERERGGGGTSVLVVAAVRGERLDEEVEEWGKGRVREQWGNVSCCHHQEEQPLHQGLYHSLGQQRQAVWQSAGCGCWVSQLLVVDE